jgi:hypothetical protein
MEHWWNDKPTDRVKLKQSGKIIPSPLCPPEIPNIHLHTALNFRRKSDVPLRKVGGGGLRILVMHK